MRTFIIVILFLCIPGITHSQWIQVPTPTTNNIADITFTDQLHGFAAAYEYILKSTDGGNSWQIALTQPNLVIADLSFPNISTGYTVGDYGLFFKTIDGGSTWFSMNSPTAAILRGVYFLNPDTGFICGQGEEIYRTEDGGNTWIQKNEGDYWLRQFSFPSHQVGYCAGDGLNVYKTTDGGNTWNHLYIGSEETNLTDILFLSTDTGYICGLYGYLAKTVNGGATWQRLNSETLNDFEGIYFFNALDGYAMGSEGLLLRTADGGITWEQEQSGTNSFLRDAFFFNRNDGFICGHDGVILKKDTIDCPAPVSHFVYSANYLVINFIDSSTTGHLISRRWDFGDSTYSNLQNPTHEYSVPGEYKVCLTVTDSCGTDSVCKLIQIECPGPVSRFVYDASLLKVYFYDSSYTAFLLSYLWDFGDSTYSTVQNPSHQYTEPGIYHVCLTVTDLCSTNVSCQDIELLLPYKLNIQIVPSEINDRLVQFEDETPGNSQWTWDFGDGEKSSLRNPSHLYKDYGTYPVCLTAGSQQNQGTLCDTLLLKVNPALHADNPVIIYPNPTQGDLFIRFFREFSAVKIIIQDLTGRSVLENQLHIVDLNSPLRLDLSQMNKGVYFISLKAEGFEKSWKIIIY